MDDTLNNDSIPSPSQWQRFVVPVNDSTSCMLWLGPYRKAGKDARTRQTPVIYANTIRVCARTTVAAHHGLCSFSDCMSISMDCKNSCCVAPMHMTIVPRMCSLKRPRYSLCQNTDDEGSMSHSKSNSSTSFTYSDSYSSSSSSSSSAMPTPVMKRARVVSAIDLTCDSLSDAPVCTDRNTMSFQLQLQEDRDSGCAQWSPLSPW
jgi:hypothetical protein